ncbi:Inorganic phosphate transporter 1-6 [Acorus calamus]|uniref:Inorganic phosphate transporter 1-6 n=1 Tax=Acorus calamus TaxID=4465 RepID=A0AAV9DTB3_ACOCL|nr:Inorganic phosphate transporter 1-6 [Acorus calamus]KAK1303608.1 Inorganic phosphate transporter 1-6 [Acorus calamus]
MVPRRNHGSRRDGFFTDAYDLLCIPFVTKLFGRIYYQVEGDPQPGTFPLIVSASFTSAAFFSSLASHLFFGWLGEKMDRKRLYFTPQFLIIISSIASGPSTGFGTLWPLLLPVLSRPQHRL